MYSGGGNIQMLSPLLNYANKRLVICICSSSSLLRQHRNFASWTNQSVVTFYALETFKFTLIWFLLSVIARFRRRDQEMFAFESTIFPRAEARCASFSPWLSFSPRDASDARASPCEIIPREWNEEEDARGWLGPPLHPTGKRWPPIIFAPLKVTPFFSPTPSFYPYLYRIPRGWGGDTRKFTLHGVSKVSPPVTCAFPTRALIARYTINV